MRRGIEEILRKQDANVEAVWPRRTAGLEVRVCRVTEDAAATSFSKSGIISLLYFWRNYYWVFQEHKKKEG